MFKISKIRESKGWSKSELSRRSGVNLPLLSHLENGKIYPYPGWKKKLGNALGVNPEILFEEVEEDESSD